MSASPATELTHRDMSEGMENRNTDLTVCVVNGSDESVRIEIRGEADVATLSTLQASLEQVPLEGNAPVQLWLSELTFCDSRALSYVATFAARVRRRGRRLTTYGASPTIRKMSAILDAERGLNLA
jgi:anti-anti-sigma factor